MGGVSARRSCPWPANPCRRTSSAATPSARPFKSRVAAVGPEIGYVFSIGGLPAYANLRGYWEFEARNRLEGYAVFLNVVLPLGR